MSGLKKIFSNIKLGKERDSITVDPVKQSDLKRSNARCFKKHNSSFDSLVAVDSVHDNVRVGENTVKTYKVVASFLQQSSRSYSFEPGASVENFETELQAHSNRLQRRHKKQKSSGSPSPTTLNPKFGLKVNNAKLSNLGTRETSALHLPLHRHESDTTVGTNTVYGRYGLVVHPSNIGKAPQNLGSHESPTPPKSPSSDIDPFEDAKATLESWKSIPSLAERGRSSESHNASKRTNDTESSNSVNRILRDLWDRYGSELSQGEWGRVVDFFSTDYSPAGSSVSFDTAYNNSSDERVSFEPHGKGKSRKIDDENNSRQPGSMSGSFPDSEDAKFQEEYKLHLQLQRLEASEGTDPQTIERRRLQEESSIPAEWLHVLVAEVERQQKQEQEEADRIKAVELEEALKREQEEADLEAAEQEQARQRLRECVACVGEFDASYDRMFQIILTTGRLQGSIRVSSDASHSIV